MENANPKKQKEETMENVAQKKRKGNSCFNYDRRVLLQGYLLGASGYPKITSVSRLAEIFHCDRKTIYNEKKRGLVEHTRSDLSQAVEYNADCAQQKADWENTGRGRKDKLGSDHALCGAVKELIVGKKYSPYAAIQYFKTNGWPSVTRICEKTLYNYVNSEAIPGIKRTDLPNKGVKYKEKGSKRRYSRMKCARHSIDLRPAEVETRETFGHWEGDTVKGRLAKGAPTDCLFTLTERKSRNEIAMKVAGARPEEIVAKLDGIERRIGSAEFRRIFGTITFDGGGEFMDIEGVERSCIDGKPRTHIYIAHPYTACERGTNENHNRMLRRFFPKGCDFSKITEKEVESAVSWMNTYPRKVLGGKTPDSVFKNYCSL